MGGKGGKVVKEHVQRTHGQSQGGVALRVGGGNGCDVEEWWGGGIGDNCT